MIYGVNSLKNLKMFEKKGHDNIFCNDHSLKFKYFVFIRPVNGVGSGHVFINPDPITSI